MISVIIPSINEALQLGGALDSLLSQRGDFEIIIADGGSTDGTLELLAGYKSVRVTHSPLGRSKQMNQGADLAKGEILLFLHADTRLPPNGLRIITQVMAKPDILAGSFYLSFDHQSPLLAFFSQMSRINLGILTYGDQGIFMRAPWFKEHGGYPDIPFMEDIELVRRLRRSGKFVKLQAPVETSARRFIKNGILRQQLLNMALVGLYYLGVSPERLQKAYDPVKRP